MFGIDKKQFAQLHYTVQEQQAMIEQLTERLAVLEDIRERKVSDEPWVEVLGGDVDPEKGLQMKLDWNDAFIDQLRAQGYKGTTEGSLVAQWLLNVSNAVKPEDDK